MHATDIQRAPSRPARDQISVNCSRWEIYDEGDAFGREWVIRGLKSSDEVTTIEISVSHDRVVTMIVEPGIPAGTPDVRAQLAVVGGDAAPFVGLQHRPIPQRPGATVFAPVDLNGLKSLLEALGQGVGMELTLIAGERELLQAPLYNDPSYRKVYQRV